MKSNKYPAATILVTISFLGGISETILSVALSQITSYFDISVSHTQLTIVVYLFAFALSQPIQGFASDYLGRKKIYLIGLLFFMAGDLVCFISSNYHYFLLGRVLQGIGASTGTIIARAIVSDHPDINYRKKAMSIIITCLATYPLLGPLIGGVILREENWKFLFLFLALLAVIFFVLNLFLLPETLHRDKMSKPKFKSFLKNSREILTNFNFLTFLCFGGLLTSITFVFISTMPFILIRHLHFSILFYSHVLVISSLSYIAGASITRFIIRLSTFCFIVISFSLIICGALILLIGNIIIPDNIYTIIGAMCCCYFGIAIAKSRTALSALLPFRNNLAGLSSAYLGMFQMLIISLVIYAIHLIKYLDILKISLIIIAIGGTCLVLSIFIKISLDRFVNWN